MPWAKKTGMVLQSNSENMSVVVSQISFLDWIRAAYNNKKGGETINPEDKGDTAISPRQFDLYPGSMHPFCLSSDSA